VSYHLCDANGFLDLACTTEGLGQLHEEVFASEGFPLLKDFLEMGACLITDQLLEEIDSFKAQDKYVQNTVKGLRRNIRKADLIIIITNGEETKPKPLVEYLKEIDFSKFEEEEHSSYYDSVVEKAGGALEITYEKIDWPPLHPKCFLDGQVPVYTSKGWKAIGTIVPGTLVLTHEGRFRKVKELLVTPLQTPDATKLSLHGRKDKTLSLTDEHPVMINGKWKEIKDVRSGDTISFLAGSCERCGADIPYFKDYCSLSCRSKDITDGQWSRPEHRKNMSEKTTQQLHREYANGTRDPYVITRKANAKTRLLVKQGLLSLQRPEVIAKMIEATNTPEQRKANSDRMKRNNPMKDRSTVERRTKTYLKTLRSNPDIHPNRIMAQRGFMSSLEKKVKDVLDTMGLNYECQYPISKYFVDFALVSDKIAIEADGDYWHQDKKRDRKRQKDIEKNGWVVIRFSESDIKKEAIPMGMMSEINRVVNNHSGNYKFMDVKVDVVERWKVRKARTLYNLNVDEDESYIAAGFVVHNCRCTVSPVLIPMERLLDTMPVGSIPQVGDVQAPPTPAPVPSLRPATPRPATPTPVPATPVAPSALTESEILEDLLEGWQNEVNIAAQAGLADVPITKMFAVQQFENVVKQGLRNAGMDESLYAEVIRDLKVKYPYLESALENAPDFQGALGGDMAEAIDTTKAFLYGQKLVNSTRFLPSEMRNVFNSADIDLEQGIILSKVPASEGVAYRITHLTRGLSLVEYIDSEELERLWRIYEDRAMTFATERYMNSAIDYMGLPGMVIEKAADDLYELLSEGYKDTWKERFYYQNGFLSDPARLHSARRYLTEEMASGPRYAFKEIAILKSDPIGLGSRMMSDVGMVDLVIDFDDLLRSANSSMKDYVAIALQRYLPAAAVATSTQGMITYELTDYVDQYATTTDNVRAWKAKRSDLDRIVSNGVLVNEGPIGDPGINVTLKLDMDVAGVKESLVFKPVSGETYLHHGEKVRKTVDETVATLAKREAISSEIGNMMEFDHIDVVTAAYGVKRGEAGVYVKFMKGYEEEIKYVGRRLTDEEVFDMSVYDYLIGNLDRHKRNWMRRLSDGRPLMIDHGYVLPDYGPVNGMIREFRAGYYGRINDGLDWSVDYTYKHKVIENLKKLDIPDLAKRYGLSESSGMIKELKRRRDRLVTYLETETFNEVFIGSGYDGWGLYEGHMDYLFQP